MSNYTQITFFAPKDALLSGNPAKLIKGADVDPELAAIATAIASKYDATNFAFANPSGTIGLAAVNGSATTPMRSDAAPALSQAISPTWSGTHTFSNAITVNGAGTSLKGGVTITTPTGGVALTVNGFGALNNPAMTVQGSNTSGARGLFVLGGTANSTDVAFLVNDAASTNNLFQVQANGTITTWHSGSVGTTFGSSGNVTINAPSSGNTLTLASASGSTIPLVITTGTGSTDSGIQVTDGTVNSQWELGSATMQIGTVSAHPLSLFTTNSTRLSIAANGTVTISAPSSGQHEIDSTGVSTALILGFQASGTTAGYLQFNDKTNANTVRGYMGFGSSLFTGAALADFGLAAAAGTLRLSANAGATTHFAITNTGVVETNDSTASLFEVGYKDTPINAPGVNYTLVASDRGKTIAITSGTTITVPNGVFSAGAAVSFLIGSGGTGTIAQGASLTMEWAGNGAATGNRTITGAALATVLFFSSSVAFISGAGLS